jgi:hypothetical protein
MSNESSDLLLAMGGESMVKVAPLRENVGEGFFFASYHRNRSQIMSTTGDKVKAGMHAAAEKTKDAVHHVGEKIRHAGL